ncbi:MAG: hypothetical protein H7Y28_16470 [Rhodoferax sp.]|nr:hypothetical protein [Rhodoferax sp.]
MLVTIASLSKSMRAPLALLSLAVLMVSVPAVHAQVPAQKPLLSKSGGGVAPNLMLTLDDSGSMMFQHMPEETIILGAFTVTHPIGGASVRMDPSDTMTLGGPGSTQGAASQFVGTIAAVPGSTNWRQKLLRSPDTNTVYYNPEIRYEPWAISTYPLPAATTAAPAGRRNNSPVAAAYLDPMNTGGSTANLTSIRNVKTRWCFKDSSTTGCQSSGSDDEKNYDPGLYYRLKKTAGGVYLDPRIDTNYVEYSINKSPFVAYPTKAAARTDCVADVSAVPKCTQAEERQNFANWFTYYRTRNLMARGAMMESFATVTNVFRVGFGRINKGSASVDGTSTTVIESDTTKYGGGAVRAFDQTRKNQLFKWLQDLPANGGTPLPAALAAVGEYYKRSDAQGPWTDNPGGTNTVADNKTCRRSYQLMMTDGYWNGTPPTVNNQDGSAGQKIIGTGRDYTYSPVAPFSDGSSNTLADVAMKYWKTDLQSTIDNNVAPGGDNPSFWQNMTNFMVGLGVRGSLDSAVDLPALSAGTKTWPAPSSTSALPANIDDLWHAAVNSRGAYYSAKDPASLATAIKGALSGAQGGTGSTTGVATASTILDSTSNRKYVPTYKAGEWSGNVSAQPLDSNGQASAAVWNAADRLPVWNLRNIQTWDTAPLATPSTPAGVSFTWATISAANKAAMSEVSSVPTTYASDFVDFLRGDHSKEGLAQPFRTRVDGAGVSFILGDFVNSNPVLIQSNFDGGYGGLNLGGANGYQNFLTAKAARDAVLFVGGNDGMLHAFKDTKSASSLTDGQEIFAYVPRAVYPNLYRLSDKTYGTATLEHQYFVDGPQSESDAFVKAPGATPGTLAASPSWRNYLVGSLGAGGRAVYALDVTSSPNLGASNIRWEISSATDVDLGFVVAPIEVGVLPNGKWVAIFGNGFSSANGYATLFVVDLESAAITKLNVDTSGSNGLGGVAVLRNTNGEITNLYAGDLKGNIWRFNYNNSSVPFAVAGGAAFFTATDAGGVAQPITQPPSLFDHSQGGKIVVFGTGKLFASADAASTSTQTIYGVWDKPLDTIPRPMSRSVLASRLLAAQNGTGTASTAVFYSLSGTSIDWTTQRGWYIDLSTVTTGGRVIYPTQAISSKLALVSVVAPAQAAVVCQNNDGIGIDLVLEVEGGTAPSNHFFDTNGDSVYDGSDAFVAGYKTNADGINSVVHSSARNSAGTVADGACPAGYYRVSIQNATGSTLGCAPVTPPGIGGIPVNNRPFNRVWRRIINPPLH